MCKSFKTHGFKKTSKFIQRIINWFNKASSYFFKAEDLSDISRRNLNPCQIGMRGGVFNRCFYPSMSFKLVRRDEFYT